MEDNGPKLKISIWILLTLATVFMVARLYAKVARGRGLWWDDHALIASWCALVISVVSYTVITQYGYGKHLEDMPVVTLAETEQFLVLSNISGTFSLLSAVWSKTSFAVTLLRITEGKIKTGIWLVIATMNLFMGLSALFIWIKCQPINKGWQPWVDGTCWDNVKVADYHIFSGAYSAAADIGLAILPWFLLMHLQMKKQEKIGVAIAMSLGVFAGATATVKCVLLPDLASPDFSFASANFSIWGTAEAAVTIMAASIPVLRVFIRDVQSSLNKYYGQDTHASGMGGSRGTKIQDGNSTVVVGGSEARGGSRMGKYMGKRVGDDGSERSILGHGKIVKTDEVAVEWKDKDDKDDGVSADRDGTSYELRRLDV